MERHDWLLLLIADGLDPIRTQKGMFLFAMESGAPAAEKYAFEPYNWGPFSQPIYGDLERLQAEGLIERVSTPKASYYAYRQTAKGQAEAARLRTATNVSLIGAVERARAEVSGIGFRELLRRIYDRYPKYATKSLFR